MSPDILTKGKRISGAVVKKTNVKKEQILKIDKIIVSIGFSSPKEFFNKIGLKRYSDGTIVVNDKMETSLEGVFAAGDVTGEVKLIAVACSEGIVAAVNTFNSITKPYWLNPTHER